MGAAAAPLHLLAAEPAPPGKRQAQQIQLQARPYEREQYPGSAPAADRDKEKERLAALVGGLAGRRTAGCLVLAAWRLLAAFCCVLRVAWASWPSLGHARLAAEAGD